MPATAARWKDVNKAVSDLSTAMTRLTSSMSQQVSLSSKIATAARDATVSARDSVVHWSKLATHAKTFATHLGSAASSLRGALWSGAKGLGFGLLGGAGGLFGLSALGSSVVSDSVRRRGMLMQAGQLQSLRAVYGGAGLDINALSQGMSAAQSNMVGPEAQAAQILGLDPRRGVFENVLALGPALRRKFAGVAPGMVGPQAEAMGLGALGVNPELIEYFRTQKSGQTEAMAAQARAGVGKTGVSEKTEEAFSNFMQQLALAGEQLKKLLAEAVTPLLKPLTELSKTFIEWLAKGLGSPEFRAAMEALPGWFEKLWHETERLVPVFKFMADMLVEQFGGLMEKRATKLRKDQQLRDLQYQKTHPDYPRDAFGDVPSSPTFNPTVEKWLDEHIRNFKLDLGPSSKGFQGGGVVDHDMTARLHEGEIVASPQQILDVIRAKESSGNYGIRGAYVGGQGRALGAYQLMPQTLATMSQRILGRRVSEQEFLSNPAMQDQIASAMVNEYLNKYHSSRDVFSMWASGHPYAESSRWADKVSGVSVAAMVAERERLLYGGGAPAGTPSIVINDNTGGSIVTTLEQASFSPPPFPM
jgi:hypothetical protein